MYHALLKFKNGLSYQVISDKHELIDIVQEICLFNDKIIYLKCISSSMSYDDLLDSEKIHFDIFERPNSSSVDCTNKLREILPKAFFK